jgi:serine/threonine protein kinase
LGLASEIKAGEPASEDTVKPAIERRAQRFEHYELVRGDDGRPVELGRGAMGVTYRAIDVPLGRPVALKVVRERCLRDKSARLRFLREARAAASVRHPNVASVFHLGKTGRSYFYAMEFVEGEPLDNLIKRLGRLEVNLALQIAKQVAAGLAALHKQDLVHRDIKPSNIMISLEEADAATAKIIDLGLAKAVHEAGSENVISTMGAFVGTPEFASPEQFSGVSIDIRSDLYSFGATLWQMLAGQPPFRGTLAELMHQHLHAALAMEQLAEVPQPAVLLLEVHGLAIALNWAANLGIAERNPAEVDRLASDLIELSTRQHFVFWRAVGTIQCGWARSASGYTVEGISWIEHGIRDMRVTGITLVVPFWLALKAEALHLADRTS